MKKLLFFFILLAFSIILNIIFLILFQINNKQVAYDDCKCYYKINTWQNHPTVVNKKCDPLLDGWVKIGENSYSLAIEFYNDCK